MGLLREFLEYKDKNYSIYSFIIIGYIQTGVDISNELLDELTQLRFEESGEVCGDLFDDINSARYAILKRKISDENLKVSALCAGNLAVGKFVNMLGDILEIGTFVGVKDNNTKKVKLAKGIFYAK